MKQGCTDSNRLPFCINRLRVVCSLLRRRRCKGLVLPSRTVIHCPLTSVRIGSGRTGTPSSAETPQGIKVETTTTDILRAEQLALQQTLRDANVADLSGCNFTKGAPSCWVRALNERSENVPPDHNTIRLEDLEAS